MRHTGLLTALANRATNSVDELEGLEQVRIPTYYIR